ncbi:TetR family transcriptional regulator [Nocardioides sp. LMS-CY]|uniref:AcrR family transcriptional regulator n=1 Tax=Nocardioides soli TaxID=1036020 RepID=A0A7W4VWI6_9ACTN|nr:MULTISPECIES: TetR/AcrR family transcriptional regulator [Nocardioides]MBB3043074.1 AcrR family transcriptional regulator [Nocardioides soli]QWF23158.1 TetR family transcriptional regulator [Nocardioides sp. LMS-CY]
MAEVAPPARDAQVSRLLAAAEALFYARGVQAVGMDEIRAGSGISLKRIYQLFRTKSDLLLAVLERRDTRWREDLETFVDRAPDAERVSAIFDWLHDWFQAPGFHGCAWINTFGELGGTDAAVVESVQAHKRAFHAFVTRAAVESGYPTAVAPALCLLAEGAIVNASINGDPAQALVAKEAAALLRSRSDRH